MLTNRVKHSFRLSSEERRRAIVDAVRGVFADKGFDGTTTRELARAAGVSEALLYKHFPSKESLYAAMLDACVKGPTLVEFKRILALEPSTSTLVVMVHFVVSRFVQGWAGDPDKKVMDRLSVRSLLGDGAFVRLTHKKFAPAWLAKFEDCLRAAAKAGELRETPLRRQLGAWLVHHVAFALMLHLHPQPPAVDYRVSRQALVEQTVWFALLGAGVKERAIKRYYNPKALSLLSG
jgi:AcrR family transcriptional regulator